MATELNEFATNLIFTWDFRTILMRLGIGVKLTHAICITMRKKGKEKNHKKDGKNVQSPIRNQ